MRLVLEAEDINEIRKSVICYDGTGRGQVYAAMSRFMPQGYLLPNDAKLFVRKDTPTDRTLSDFIWTDF